MGLRSSYAPSRDEIWKQLAEKIGGKFENGDDVGKEALRLSAGEWEITLDTHVEKSGRATAIFTRMRAPFVNKDGFYFKIYREGVFSPLGKLFGEQDIIIGDGYFDEKFMIQGNNEDKVKLLFQDDRLKELIHEQPDICFEIKDDEGWFGASFPDGVDALHFRSRGIIEDEARLKNLFELFSATLERLVQIDSAYEDNPDLTL